MNSNYNWPFSKKLMFSLISIVFFIVLLEGTTFLYTKLKAVALIKTHKMPALRGDIEGRIAEAYTSIDYTMMAYSQMRFLPVKDKAVIGINSLGFRGKEFSLIKGKDTYRIIILGGSTAFGKGASSDSTTIAGYLERILNDRIKGKNFEVCNMAISGYISAQELVSLQFHGIYFQPDLVIAINGYNDLVTGMHDADYPPYASTDSEPVVKAYNTLWKGPFYPIALVVLKRWSYFVKHLSAKMQVEYSKRYFASPGIKEKLIASRMPRIDFYIKNMNTFYALAEYYKFRFVAVLQPTLMQKSPLTKKEQEINKSYFECSDSKQLFPYIISTYYPVIASKMHELDNNNKHFFIDFSPLFQNTKEQVFIDIVHYNDKGNKIFAEKLYEKILPIIKK